MSVLPSVVKRLTDYENPNSIGSKLRARRSEHLLGVLRATHREQGKVRVIDIGGRRAYWHALPEGVLDELDVHVTVVNLPDEPHPTDSERFTHIEGNGCALEDVADLEFDVAHANSVLEHVGQWPQMVDFASEIRRVARRYVVQTPDLWCPIEPHYMAPILHWLPEPTRARIVLRFELGQGGGSPTLDHAMRVVQSVQLVNRTLFRTLFPDARLHTERVFGIPKSLIGVRT